MKSKIPHLKFWFLGAFAVLSLAMTTYQLMYAIPRKKCENSGNWWSDKYRECAVPLRLVDITRRPAPSQDAAASQQAQ